MDLPALAVDGIIASTTLAAAGLRPREIARGVGDGVLHPLTRGWYAVGVAGRPAPWERATPWESERARHVLALTALVREFGGRAVASHQSTIALGDGRLWGVDLGPAHLTRVIGSRSRRRAGLWLHASLPSPSPIVEIGGRASLHPAIAALQLGMIDQGEGSPSPLSALVAVDGLLHDGVITREHLEEALTALAGRDGIDPVRTLVRHADGRHESVGETRTAHDLRLLGYDFDTQVRIDLGGRVVIVDFLLRGEPVAIEFDGLGKYGGMVADPTALQVRAGLRAEKQREDDLRAAGYGVARPVWGDLGRLETMRRKVETAREQARRYGRTG